MFKKSQIFFLIAETPVHAGSGSELGLVDLPIQRERYTKYPKIEASGLKGCIREAFESLVEKNETGKKYVLIDSPLTKKLKEIFPDIEEPWQEKGNYKLIKFNQSINLIFGPEGEETHAGAIAFTDARILLFPVKSLKGVFAWITCPMVLERFREDLALTGEVPSELEDIKFSELKKTVPKESEVKINSKVVLEEYTFEVNENETTGKIAEYLALKIFPQINGSADPYKFWREKLEKSLVTLSDDDFEQFVVSSTEVITRTKIDNITGTVQPGALWTEEYLPQDTIMYSIAMVSNLRVESDEQKGIFKGLGDKEPEKILEFLQNGIPHIIQIGGNQTIGKGLMRVHFLT